MAQFHAYRISNDRLVLDLQTDFVDTGTRVVAPLLLLLDGPPQIKGLEPTLPIGGIDHILHTAEMAAVPTGLLAHPPVANLIPFDYEIRRALDMVFTGF